MSSPEEKIVVHQCASDLYTRLDSFLDENGVYTFTRGQSNVWQFIQGASDETVWGTELCWRVMKSHHCLAFFYAYPEDHASYKELRAYALRNALFFTVDIGSDYMDGLINYICDNFYSRSSLNSPLRSLSQSQIRRIPHEWMVQYLKIDVYDFSLLSRSQQEAHVLDVVTRKEFLLLDFKGNKGMFELLKANPACMVYMNDAARRKIDYALYVLSRYEECKESFSGTLQNIIEHHFLGPMSDRAYVNYIIHHIMTPLQSYDTFRRGFTSSHGTKRQKSERVFLPEELLRYIFEFVGFPPARFHKKVAKLQCELAIRNPFYAKGLSQLQF